MYLIMLPVDVNRGTVRSKLFWTMWLKSSNLSTGQHPVQADHSSVTLSLLYMQHVRQQYEEVKPILDALVAAYPSYMQPDWFTLEAYLWAVQLWYAYAMQVGLLCIAPTQA